MSLSSLPLSYCTNVHPGRSVAEVEKGLDDYAVAVRERFGAPLAAGLWLARPVADDLAESEDTLRRFRDGLHRRGLTCHTLNAFPYGDFHSDRVKENVYLPDWSQPQRLQYTETCASLLAALLPDALDEGSISTVPLGFKGFTHPPDFIDRCIQQLIETAAFLALLRERTRKTIRVGIEPEPLCLLETTTETLAFFERLFARADDEGRGEIARTHLGVCYDVCHQAVEFEDVRGSIAALDAAGIRVNKMHISCALQLDDPTDVAARSALLRFVEPRYLHQTTALTRDGDVVRVLDLDDALVESPGEDFRDARTWRVHFHVPVDADRMGTLATTRPALRDALAAVAALRYSPHLEVETYTWDVMPGRQSVDLAEALARELTAARWMIVEAAEPSPQAQKKS